MDVELTVIEKAKLENLEMVVEQNIGSALKAALALRTIRDEKLYREAYLSFDEYTQTRFGFQRAHAYRLIQYADVTDVVSPVGDILPNERQARELARLDETQQQQEAWEEVVSTTEGEPTAEETRKVVERKLGGSDPAERATKPAKAKLKRPQEFDHFKRAWGLLDDFEEESGEIIDDDDLDALATRLDALARILTQRADAEMKLKRNR